MPRKNTHTLRHRPHARRTTSWIKSSYGRRLRVEELEDRRMLAGVTVGNALDVVNAPDTSSIAALVANDGGDGISLREAITAANNDANDPSDTISFDTGVFSTARPIMLGSQLPTITDDLTITGPGANLLTLDAGGGTDGTVGNGDGYRLFELSNSTAQIDVQMSGMTLTGGDTSANGGAIENNGERLTLTAMLIADNAANTGGGVDNLNGDLTVSNSTFANNVSTAGGGAGGGAIFTQNGPFTVTNSTFSSNSATNGGAIQYFLGDATVSNSTFYGNSANTGGAIQVVSGAFTVNNSIVAGSPSGGDVAGTITGSHNLIQDGSGGLSDTITGDPLLGPLADNGGPTPTHALPIGSPAIDAGNSTLTSDQRGLTRPVDITSVANAAGGNGADIGAYEPQLNDLLVVNSTADSDDGDILNGVTSLREAISFANSQSAADTITFDASVFNGEAADVIRLQSGALAITEAVHIDGGALDVVISGDAAGNDVLVPGTFITDIAASDAASRLGDNNGSVLDVTAAAGHNVQLTGLTITGGNQSSFGGGIFSDSADLVIGNSSISGNRAVDSGGGISTITGAVTLTGSTISGNSTTGDLGDGGGIHTNSGAVTLTDSTASGNSASGFYGEGGGIFSNSGAVTLTGSTVSGNSAAHQIAQGGGIYTSNGAVTLTSSTISGNSSGARGAGIYTGYGVVTLTSSTITGNSSGIGGGGIAEFAASSISLQNTIVAGNLTNGMPSDINTDLAVSAGFSLIGDNTGSTLTEAPVGSPDANGNLVGGSTGGVINPLLSPLQDNGGLTLTHALLPGSPAIDAGNPDAVAGQNGVPEFDQRGSEFDRVVGGRIDMGAFEAQNQPALPGDYNENGSVDTADYTVWRDRLGQSVTPYSSADGDGDGEIDQDDYEVWVSNFGATLPGSASLAVSEEPPAEPISTPADEQPAELVAELSAKPLTEVPTEPAAGASVELPPTEATPSLADEQPVALKVETSAEPATSVASAFAAEESVDPPPTDPIDTSSTQSVGPAAADAVFAFFDSQSPAPRNRILASTIASDAETAAPPTEEEILLLLIDGRASANEDQPSHGVATIDAEEDGHSGQEGIDDTLALALSGWQ